MVSYRFQFYGIILDVLYEIVFDFVLLSNVIHLRLCVRIHTIFDGFY